MYDCIQAYVKDNFKITGVTFQKMFPKCPATSSGSCISITKCYKKYCTVCMFFFFYKQKYFNCITINKSYESKIRYINEEIYLRYIQID